MSKDYVRYPKMYGGEYEAMRAYGSLVQASAAPELIASSGAMGASIEVSALAGASVFAQQQKAKRKVKKKKPLTKRKKTTKKR